MRWLASSIAALAVWAAASAPALARTGLEEPLTAETAVSAPAIQVSARRTQADGDADRVIAPRNDAVERDAQEAEAGRTLACPGRDGCTRRRGAPTEAIPDRALMRQRAIL